MVKTSLTQLDYIRKLRQEKKLLDHHVEAAAKFEKLVYSGYGGDSSQNLERVDGTPQNNPPLAGLRLGKLSAETSRVLALVIVYDKTLVHIGFMLGAKSRRSAYRWGLDALKYHLDEAYNILR